MLYPTKKYNSKYDPDISQSSSEQDQSSCSQCKRQTYGIRQEEEEQSSLQLPHRRHRSTESSSDDEIQVPLRKNINENNYQFEQMLRTLQIQVETLKRQNQLKDEIINELKIHVHRNIVEEEKIKEVDKQAYEINRLKHELGCSPRNKILPQSKGFKASSIREQYNSVAINAGYQTGQNLLQSFNPNFQYTQTKQANKNPYLNLATHQSYPQFQLRIALLQKQLREYQLQSLQQKQLITKLEQENKWQQMFIISFVKMCDQLSLTYGQKLKLNKLGNDLKKKTKVSWNYMKNLVAYFIDSFNRSNNYQITKKS